MTGGLFSWVLVRWRGFRHHYLQCALDSSLRRVMNSTTNKRLWYEVRLMVSFWYGHPAKLPNMTCNKLPKLWRGLCVLQQKNWCFWKRCQNLIHGVFISSDMKHLFNVISISLVSLCSYKQNRHTLRFHRHKNQACDCYLCLNQNESHHHFLKTSSSSSPKSSIFWERPVGKQCFLFIEVVLQMKTGNMKLSKQQFCHKATLAQKACEISRGHLL